MGSFKMHEMTFRPDQDWRKVDRLEDAFRFSWPEETSVEVGRHGGAVPEQPADANPAGGEGDWPGAEDVTGAATVDANGVLFANVFLFAPNNRDTIDAEASARLSLTGIADANASDRWWGPGDASATTELDGAAHARVFAFAPNNHGTINALAEAEAILDGSADARAADGGGNADATTNVAGLSSAEIFIFAPRNHGVINAEANSATEVAGRANADAPDDVATASVGLDGRAFANIVVFAPDNKGEIRTDADASVTGVTDAAALGGAGSFAQAEAWLAAAANNFVFDPHHGWFDRHHHWTDLWAA